MKIILKSYGFFKNKYRTVQYYKEKFKYLSLAENVLYTGLFSFSVILKLAPLHLQTVLNWPRQLCKKKDNIYGICMRK